MTLRNSHQSYGSIAKLFHWSIALLVVIMLLLGLSFGFVDKSSMRTLMFIHKSIGFTILCLMVLRLLWRFANPTPRLPEATPKWQVVAGHSSHLLLYLLLILMPISGLIMSTSAGYSSNIWGLFSIKFPGIPKDPALHHLFEDIHFYLAWAIVTVAALHVLAALRHHFINKDNVLRRMLPGSTKN